MTTFYKHFLTLPLLVCLVAKLSGQTYEVRPGIDNIVDKLRKENEVHFGYPVGFAGIPETNNKYYKLYLKLKDKATDDELVQLTKDTSECIYAVVGVQTKNISTKDTAPTTGYGKLS